MPRASTLRFPYSVIQVPYFDLKLSGKILKTLSFLTILALAAFFIYQNNLIIKKTYLLADYEDQIEALSAGNENLKIKTSQMDSLGSVEEAISKLNYEKIGETRYIQVLEPRVVIK